MPLILSEFATQEAEVALNAGMPGIRIQYFRGPVWAKTHEQLKKQIVEGNNPITGKPVMRELVEKLTQPLTAEERKSGPFKQDMGPATFTGTPDELQKLFLEKRFTDFMPVILPTEEKVTEMLKATSHPPDEQLGKMNPGSEAGETWTYTVKVAAINAVMADARPEYFPVILALGSTGMSSVNVSDNGFAAGAIINGNIRDEIGLNYDVGAWNNHDVDAVLAHYSDDFEMTTPMIRRVLGIESGTLRGKKSVGDYWRSALKTVPDLRFSIIEVACGVGSVSIYYNAVMGKKAIETFLFNDKGEVYKAMATYN